MNETYVTFALDVQLNDHEDWIAAGTKVKVSDNPFHVNRFEDAIPVIITEGFAYNGDKMKFEPHVEWFMKCSFVKTR